MPCARARDAAACGAVRYAAAQRSARYARQQRASRGVDAHICGAIIDNVKRYASARGSARCLLCTRDLLTRVAADSLLRHAVAPPCRHDIRDTVNS